MTECGKGQCFTFEGVESSLLSFSLVSDDGSLAAPVPDLTDPEGKRVELSPFMTSPEGAATTGAAGIPLRRTGIYRVALANPTPGHQVFYRFQYRLDFPPIQDLRVTLTPEQATPIYVSAPRGGLVDLGSRPGAAREWSPTSRASWIPGADGPSTPPRPRRGWPTPW
jgi:hypothetical protein